MPRGLWAELPFMPHTSHTHLNTSSYHSLQIRPLVIVRWRMACVSSMSPKKLKTPFCIRTDHTTPSMSLFYVSSKLKETKKHLTTYWGSTGLVARACPTTPARSRAAGGTRHTLGMGMGWDMSPHVGPLVEAHLQAGLGCEEQEPSSAGAGAEDHKVTWAPGPGSWGRLGWSSKAWSCPQGHNTISNIFCFTLYNTDRVLRSKIPSILSSSLH